MLNRSLIEHNIAMLRKVDADERLAQNFDITGFVTLTSKSNLQHPTTIEPEQEPTCGFAGCWIGWAAHQRWFEPFGVTITFTKDLWPIFTIGDHKLGLDVAMATGEALGVDANLDAQLVGARLIFPEAYAAGDCTTAGDVADRLEALLELGVEKFIEKFEDEVAPE